MFQLEEHDYFPAGISRSGCYALSVFDISHNDAPMAPIPVGPLLLPTFIAFDHSGGKRYVSNFSTQRISVFDTHHGEAASPSITAGLIKPQGIPYGQT